jgi:hypothetical protein
VTNATTTPCHDADLCVPGGSADFYAAYKERLPPSSANTTAAECARNWATRHSGGGAGYCYLVDFPVETLLYEADDRKAGAYTGYRTWERRRRRWRGGTEQELAPGPYKDLKSSFNKARIHRSNRRTVGVAAWSGLLLVVQAGRVHVAIIIRLVLRLR